jgi:hypothetical protein
MMAPKQLGQIPWLTAPRVAIPGDIAIFEPHQAQTRLCTCARRTRSRAARIARVANRDPAASRTMCR